MFCNYVRFETKKPKKEAKQIRIYTIYRTDVLIIHSLSFPNDTINSGSFFPTIFVNYAKTEHMIHALYFDFVNMLRFYNEASFSRQSLFLNYL